MATKQTPLPRREAPNRFKNGVIIAMSVLILVPSMLGFVNKFLEFMHTFRASPDGKFAITPMLNYLLASLGFFCLLVWAAFNGMFHDIERPKHHMLELHEMLENQHQGKQRL